MTIDPHTHLALQAQFTAEQLTNGSRRRLVRELRRQHRQERSLARQAARVARLQQVRPTTA